MNNDSASITLLALVIGGLLVLVIGLYAGGVILPQRAPDTSSTSVTIETPAPAAPAPSSPPAGN
jgi:hypothetical protein